MALSSRTPVTPESGPERWSSSGNPAKATSVAPARWVGASRRLSAPNAPTWIAQRQFFGNELDPDGDGHDSIIESDLFNGHGAHDYGHYGRIGPFEGPIFAFIGHIRPSEGLIIIYDRDGAARGRLWNCEKT